MVNTRHEVVAIHRCHVGTLNTSVAAAEVCKTAILNHAAGLIAAHNHPSGHVELSKQNMQMTTTLMETGHVLGRS
ncbi:JAB domain-containing protein [Paenibacillus xerothermodurans]|uniref:JAB domain-containing protein n=1 Tax=Paenibacillus xerothermodurans TaxID=1977292 RepID=UPI003C710EFF